MFLKNKKGQSTLEFAVLIGVVVASAIAMQVYMKRGVSGKLKSGVDQIGTQYDPQNFSSNYATNTNSVRRDTVSGDTRITRSELISDETTHKTGSETLTAWEEKEDLFRAH